jgi:hypothetical protein
MIKQIVFQFRFWRAIRQARRDGSPDAVKKLIDENPKLKARFPDGHIERVLMAVEEQCRLTELSQRPRQYTATCGTGELACGLMWFGMAGGGLWSLLMPASAANGRIGTAITIAGFVAGWFLLLAGKRLVVQPRVGYFAMRPEKWRWAGMIAGMTVGMVVAVVIACWLATEHAHAILSAAKSNHQAFSTASTYLPVTQKDVVIMAVTGVLNAFLYLMVNAVSIKQHRWKWACLAVLLLIPPATIFSLPGDMAHRELPMNFLQSLIWLFSGVVTLIWFLRQHKPVAPETE